MRSVISILTLVLAACGGTGFEVTPEPIQHVPEIRNVNLSPDGADHMEGVGSVVVAAEISFADAGRDIQTLWIQIPDGTTIGFDAQIATEAGAFTQNFTVLTETVGAFPYEFWLVDGAGDSSDHVTAVFTVVGESQSGDWTNRLSGLPYALNDVIWNGSIFVAVGGSGTILTSADGINWVTRKSGTDASLGAVAAHGSDIFAVGGEIVLLSADHGETWITRTAPDAVVLFAVAASSSQVVVSGSTSALEPIVMISENRGVSWQVFNPWPNQPLYVTDLVYRDGLFVAAADTFFFNRVDGGWVFVSSDGTLWDDVFHDPKSGFSVIVDDGSRFTVAGSDGAVITSFDGLNWTTMQTPEDDVDYHSAAWSGTKLVIAGGYPCFLHNCSPPDPPLPYGIASTDGGATWDIFNIDGHYLSLGMAYGNGRFVSVGQSTPSSGEGAIYTAD